MAAQSGPRFGAHFDGGSSATGESMGRNGKGESGSRGQKGAQAENEQQETPFWEKVAGVVGLLIVVGVVGFLLYEAFQPQTEAEIVTHVMATIPQGGSYLVKFEAANRGDKTAEAVVVEGALYEAAQEDGASPVETAEVQFDYVPDKSQRAGAFLFHHDPAAYELRLQVKGYTNP